MENTVPGVEKFKWDLRLFYSGITDPQMNIDIKEFTEKAVKFQSTHKGKLAITLPQAIIDYSEIVMLEDKLVIYLYLLQSLDVANTEVNAKMAEVESKLNQTRGEYLTFFEIELIQLSDEVLEKMYGDPILEKHKPWIKHVRTFKPHTLSEPVESALTKRSQFGLNAWNGFFDEFEADLEFTHKSEKKTLTEMLHILSSSKDAAERFDVMTNVNTQIGITFAKYSAQNLYIVTGSQGVETKERSYTNPMTERNKANRIPDSVVDALHSAVQKVAGPLAQRYYKLKAAHLGLKNLKWSDRNAPMPFSDTTIIPFDEGLDITLAAYESFSPTLKNLIQECVEQNRIDAPATKTKRSGAFNYSLVLPGNTPATFTFLSYLGSNRDVMTLAHELGHGVHGLLSGKEQGVLMGRYPMAYAETASIFGEMTTFNFLKKRLLEKGEMKSLLSLLMGKIDDTLNTMVRQISFSDFERRIHGMDSSYTKWHEPKKMSVQELNAIWLEVTKRYYGEEGTVFTYENIEHLWSYIRHFHRPFYVYSYAFGELLTQSIYAKQSSIGDNFETLYLDLLKSGMTKNVVDLLKPFDLDPTDENFWINGINAGLGAMITEAEQASRDMGISI